MSPTAPSLASWRTRSYLGAKQQFLGVHQFAPVLTADGNHVIGFLERDGQRLLDDDVLAGASRGDRGPMMKEVRQTDVDHLAVGLGNQLVDVGEPLRNAPVFRDALGVFRCPREHRR